MNFIERHLHYTIYRNDAFMEVHAVVEDSNQGEMQTILSQKQIFFFVHSYLNFSIERKINEKDPPISASHLCFVFF